MVAFKACVKLTHCRPACPYRAVDHNGLNTFFKVQAPIRSGGRLAPGRYQFPFLFVLPQGLPASFSFSKGSTRWVSSRGQKDHV